MAAQKIDQEPCSPAEDAQLPTPPPESTALSIEKPEPKLEMMKDSAASPTVTDDKESTEIAKEEVLSSKKDETTTETAEKGDSKGEPKDDTKKEDDDSKADDKDKKDEKKDEKKEEEKKKALPRGMKADLKLLWAKTDAQCKCCTTWVEENPDDGKNVEESDECLQHAIVVRKKKKHEGNRKPLKVDSIVVHSPLIKQVLQTVFTGYRDLVVDLDELIFDTPFAPFFHRWEKFQKAVQDETDEMTKSHLTLLHDALEKELEKPIQRNKDLIRHKAIDFDLLWTLYTPGTLMYSRDDGHDRLYDTNDCEYYQDLTGMKFAVRCEHIEWDGETFGKQTMTETMSKFKGTKQITTLPTYPLRFHPKAEEMKAKCVERGRRFQELAGVHCKDYKGTAIEYTKYSIQTVSSKRHLEGRVMLDEELFSKFNPEEALIVRDLGEDIEDVERSEAEAAERLAEQAKKAIEALKKAQEEQKRKDEEEKKKKEEEKRKEDEKTKEEEKQKGQEKKNGEGKMEEEEDKEKLDNVQEDTRKASEEPTSDETPKEDSKEDLKEDSDTAASKVLLQTRPQKAPDATDDTATEKLVEAPDSHTKSESSEEAVTVAVAPEISSTMEKDSSTVSSSSTDSEGLPTPALDDDDDDEETVKESKSYSDNKKQDLNEDQLAICTSWIRGYSLAYQKWASFSVEHISDVAWNDDAFSELTLPPEYRELILATIQSQIRHNQWKQKMEKADKEQKPISSVNDTPKDEDEDEDEDEEEEDDNPAQFDDFIAQKGLGYIMLFSGNPGVGKTATAESIAELLHVPLCIISVGNLGTSAESVESALQDVLELASKWNAVLLLDEADIFLEQRAKHDIHRNAVVSVFLRLLEYYQGILLLTSNRSAELDEAFHSRIHLSLPFPDLTENNREQIWRHFAKLTNKKHEASAARRSALAEKKKKQKAATTTASTATTQPRPSPSEPESKSEPESESSPTTSTSISTSHASTPSPQSPSPPPPAALIDLTPADFRKLSQTPLNGRQIKNAFKTAVLLASYKKERVQMKHVKTALRTIDGNGLGRREVRGMYY